MGAIPPPPGQRGGVVPWSEMTLLSKVLTVLMVAGGLILAGALVLAFVLYGGG